MMVDVFNEYAPRKRPAEGFRHPHGRQVNIYFNEELFLQIQAEAISRGWPLGRMIRFLCEASIDGIE